MVKETKKIWGQQDVSITATCIRVPIMRAHAESINLEFERDISEQEVGCYAEACSKAWEGRSCGASFQTWPKARFAEPFAELGFAEEVPDIACASSAHCAFLQAAELRFGGTHLRCCRLLQGAARPL